MAGLPRAGLAPSPEEAEGPAHGGADAQGQREEVGRAGAHRARLRAPEGAHGPIHPDHWPSAGGGEDRAGQSDLQSAALRLPRAAARDRIAAPVVWVVGKLIAEAAAS